MTFRRTQLFFMTAGSEYRTYLRLGNTKILLAPYTIGERINKVFTMDKLVGKVALVTGASAGIGAAISKRLVEHGMKVVGCARNIQHIQARSESLKEHQGSLTAIKCDLSKEDQILSMFNTIKKQFGGVNICVNNAGIGHNAPLLSGSTEHWRRMYDVNVLGLMICSREAIKSMEERRVDDGVVILVNSLAGHKVYPVPEAHVYTSTKYAVTAIAEGMRNELNARGSHIRVISISPGVTDTRFFNTLYKDDPKSIDELYRQHPPLQAKDVVDSIVYSISAPLRTQIHDIHMASL